jgi:hypothetical protein
MPEELFSVAQSGYVPYMAKRLRAVRIKELKKLAKKEDETVSSLIQRSIREFLDREAAKAPTKKQPDFKTDE